MCIYPQARVSLVGAGPGDPDLITRKGLKALQTADVVLYDALAAPELLTEAPSTARQFYVGKRAGRHSMRQEKLNELIVRLAFRYGHVVRLKGGDPFVFGRGHEELEEARRRQIPVSIVPGISSCIALPALQQVPITRRGISESFWVLTATTRKGQLSEDLRLAAQSTATVLILMGMRRLREIAAHYVSIGKGALPAMVIQNGSRADERCFTGSIDQFVERISVDPLAGPGIIVLGSVVGLHANFAKTVALQQLNRAITR